MTIVLPVVLIPIFTIAVVGMQPSTEDNLPITSAVIETNDSITKYYVEKLKEMGIIKIILNLKI